MQDLCEKRTRLLPIFIGACETLLAEFAVSTGIFMRILLLSVSI